MERYSNTLGPIRPLAFLTPVASDAPPAAPESIETPPEQVSARRPQADRRVRRLIQMLDHLNRCPDQLTYDTMRSECGVARRTFFRDLKFLRELGYQIPPSHGSGQSPQAFGRNMTRVLTVQELAALLTFLDRRMEPSHNRAYAQTLNRAIQKLVALVWQQAGELKQEIDAAVSIFCKIDPWGRSARSPAALQRKIRGHRA